MKKSVFVEIICFLFVLLFVYAAVSKLMDVEKFRVQVGQSPLLTNFAGFVSWFIPCIELIASALLIARSHYRLIGLYLCFGLMCMFTAYIVAITQFTEYVPCSCGGILQSMTWSEHFVFNTVFDTLALIGIALQTKEIHAATAKNKKYAITTI